MPMADERKSRASFIGGELNHLDEKSAVSAEELFKQLGDSAAEDKGVCLPYGGETREPRRNACTEGADKAVALSDGAVLERERCI